METFVKLSGMYKIFIQDMLKSENFPTDCLEKLALRVKRIFWKYIFSIEKVLKRFFVIGKRENDDIFTHVPRKTAQRHGINTRGHRFEYREYSWYYCPSAQQKLRLSGGLEEIKKEIFFPNKPFIIFHFFYQYPLIWK